MRSDEIAHGEIIIVRRNHDEHEDHHGGVWKIAFADFMTAMMAFFLVMWLINAANEETKKAVASYFTPIKLTDRTSNPKGLNEAKYGKPQDKPTPEKSDSTYSSGGELDNKSPDPVQVDEQALFSNPYAVLSEIAGGLVSGPSEDAGADAAEENRRMGMKGGEAYYDPFDPSAWNTELGLAKKAETGGEFEKSGQPVKGAGENDIAAILAAEGNVVGQPAGKNPAQGSEGRLAGDVAAADAEMGTNARMENAGAATASSESESPDESDVAEGNDLQRQAQAVRQQLMERLGTSDAFAPVLDVDVDGASVRINLSDDGRFGMFDIGSAVPRKKTVEVIGEIGAMLAEFDGQIVIAGHTDGRDFRSKQYDNWRLSTDRAHIARHMLIRGGLDGKRILKVEGFADTRPALADDPYAAVNRRIEIFLRRP